MNNSDFKRALLAEQDCAHIHGWDFSHIHGRYTEETDLPWDYDRTVRSLLDPRSRLLDIDTGGGEYLLSLGHPHSLTFATEGYPPNIELCRSTLLPLGVGFRPCDDCGAIPFPDGSFEIIIDRHGDWCAHEINRLLAPGGVFVTEQVGGQNDRELAQLLLPGTPAPFPDNDLAHCRAAFEREGLNIEQADEAFRPIRFFDVGALVWFARIIEWEFPGFSVERCFPQLLDAQKMIETHGEVSGRIHRFLLAARKPKQFKEHL